MMKGPGRGTVAVPEKLAVKILSDLSSGLKAIHEKDVAHLDMKNENVFIDGSGAMKIGDFGISQMVGKEEDGKIVDKIGCSPSFMAPETGRNQITKKSDLWGLGLIMYFVCTIAQRANVTKPYD